MKNTFFGFLAFFLLILSENSFVFAQQPTFKIAKLQYEGGGDWYSNKTALPNLINFCRKNLKIKIRGIASFPKIALQYFYFVLFKSAKF